MSCAHADGAESILDQLQQFGPHHQWHGPYAFPIYVTYVPVATVFLSFLVATMLDVYAVQI